MCLGIFILLGQYLDETRFLDRFGSALYLKFMNTGSKAALALYYCNDTVVSGIELGYNALGAVIKYCKRGYLLLPACNYFIEGELDDWDIDVICRGKHHMRLNAFADYLMKEAPDD